MKHRALLLSLCVVLSACSQSGTSLSVRAARPAAAVHGQSYERPSLSAVSAFAAAQERAAAIERQAQRSGRSAARSAPTQRRTHSFGVERWRSLVASVGTWDVDTVLGFMQCESKGDPNAYNPIPVRDSHGVVHHAQGLMQILDGPYDPTANLRLAFSMYQQRRWGPWAACS